MSVVEENAESRGDIFAVKEMDPLSDVDLIIENRLSEHVDARLKTIEVKLDQVVEFAAKFTTLMDEATESVSTIMEKLEDSPLWGVLQGGGGFPGFPGFSG